MAKHHFTLEEAENLLKWLEQIFQMIMPLQQNIEEQNDKIRELQNRIPSNGDGAVEVKILTCRRNLEKISHKINEQIQLIHEHGILVKNISPGLVDFPCIKEGREVYLCWQSGEQNIQFWHDVNVGFAGRQAL